jgi:hypothetical protein
MVADGLSTNKQGQLKKAGYEIRALEFSEVAKGTLWHRPLQKKRLGH